MKEIDDMWHTFLLFTKDYMDFCNHYNHYFGEYIHHHLAKEDEVLPKEGFEQEFNLYLSYIYDHLGEGTLNVWFNDLLAETL